MANDSANSSSLEQKVDELIRRLDKLEEHLAQFTKRIYRLEERAGINLSREAARIHEPISHAALPSPMPVPTAGAAPPARQSSPPAQVQPHRQSAAAPSPVQKKGLEEQIGGNWLLWVGMIAIVLGTVYFLKLAFENNWIGPSGRVGIGFLFGSGLILWGEALQKHKYPYYGQIVTGGGSAIYYLSIYAAFNFYHLIPPVAAFSLMAMVTVAVAVLAVRYSSLALAFMGLIGGFLTPIWLKSGEDHQIFLLTYISILVAGVAYLSRLRDWMILNYTGFVLTVLIFGSWADQFYSREKRGATEFFLVLLAALFLYIGMEALGRLAQFSRQSALWLMWAAGFLFYVFSVANLFTVAEEIFAFVALFAAAAFIASLRARQTGVFGAAVALNVVSIALWLIVEYRETQLSRVLTYITMVFVIHLAASLWLVLREKLSVTSVDLAITIGNGLAFFGALYYLLEPHHHNVLGLLAALMSAVYFGISRAAWKQIPEEKKFTLVTLGLAITFLTLAIPIQLKQHWITLFWAMEAVVLTWVAMRTASLKMLQASWVVTLAVLLRLILYDHFIALDSFQVVLNKRFFTFLFVILACYAMAWLLRNAPEELRAVNRESFRAFILLASFLTVVLMSLEAASFYEAKQQVLIRIEALRDFNPTGGFRDLESGKQVAYSILWGIYSVTLIVVGIIKRYRDIRLFAMALFALTIAKVFFVDLKTLEVIYKVFSMIGLGAILLLVAYLYQHYRKAISE
jgi:uncharacterized membrane protein